MLEEWERQLRRGLHNLDQVIVVVNEPPDGESASYSEKLATLNFGTPHLVMRRRNEGGSYGAWMDVWRKFRYYFDWYFVFEDDNVPTADNWDDKMLAFMAPEVGYVGQYILGGGAGEHMAAANGVVRETAFLDKDHYWEHQHAYDPDPQIMFSQMIVQAGYKLVDFSGEYAIPFWSGVTRYLSGTGIALVTPVETLRGY